MTFAACGPSDLPFAAYTSAGALVSGSGSTTIGGACIKVMDAIGASIYPAPAFIWAGDGACAWVSNSQQLVRYEIRQLCDPMPAGGTTTVAVTATANVTVEGVSGGGGGGTTSFAFDDHLADFGVTASNVMLAMAFGLGFVLLMWWCGYMVSMAVQAIRKI